MAVVLVHQNGRRRVLLISVAGILLNLGLFVVLAIFAPLVAGIIVGYLMIEIKWTIVGSLASGTIAYGSLFLATEAATGWTSDPNVLLIAVLIMALLCVAGALIGSIIAGRTRNS